MFKRAGLTLCEHYIKTITMGSVLKKIAVRKNYKENISMESGVDPTNFRTAAERACHSAIINYGCLMHSHSDYIRPFTCIV